jgi:K+-transporting ATPase ATPase C chain
MTREIVVALRMTVVTLVLTGLAYPLALTGIAQAILPGQANGSLVTDAGGTVVGSELIAQAFTSRSVSAAPSAAATLRRHRLLRLNPAPRPELRDRVSGRRAAAEGEPGRAGRVPAELVSASGSGLDPHVSPDGARWQVPRVAKARGHSPEEVQTLVDAAVEGRTLGFLGEPTVNVLRLNLTLDRQFGPAAGR